MDKRKQQEASFHNTIRSDNVSEHLISNRKFYSIARKNNEFVNNYLTENCLGKRVLDYCCGNGETTIYLAKRGAEAIGIDISDTSISNAKKSIHKNASFFVMDAENLNFEDNYFDIIVCNGVLHHLDINKAYMELSRVLKPDGIVICDEPLAYNPIFQLYRKLTPHLRTDWEAEHILTKESINLASRYFGKKEERFYHLATLLAVPFRGLPGFNILLKFLERVDSLLLKIPFVKWMSWQVVFTLSKPNKLAQEARKFWYSNTPGTFELDKEKISRKTIFTHGGPNPKFTCPICQKSEWLSRIKQKDIFVPHDCSQSKECQTLCSHQGNELWTHEHQNFDFFSGCNPNLPAPKCLFLNDVPSRNYKKYFTPCCDQGGRVFRRQWAYSCQVDMVRKPVNINWDNYDFLFIDISGCEQRFTRPNIPIILYGHESWAEPKKYQEIIDWLKPDIFMTSYPTQWKENYRFPSKTKIAFYPLFSSRFFARPNLSDKRLDLLVIGATCAPVYKARVDLDRQISKLAGYKIEFSHLLGYKGARQKKENYHYLNKWSEYLSSARYVVFGKIIDPRKQALFFKYYETLGSGAIPIFHEVPDLKLLGVNPFEHYIPLSEIENNNDRLTYFLDHYEDYKYIAKNAVKWFNKVSDGMLFNGFEENIRQITNYKYPKRII